MREYELITILESGEKTGLEETKNTLTEIFQRNQVELVKEDDWGIRKLQYDIANQNSGHFILHHCKIAPEKVKDLTHELELEQRVMRYMLRRAA